MALTAADFLPRTSPSERLRRIRVLRTERAQLARRIQALTTAIHFADPELSVGFRARRRALRAEANRLRREELVLTLAVMRSALSTPTRPLTTTQSL